MVGRYFVWSNQTLSVFTLWALTVYLTQTHKLYLITLVPVLFMSAETSSYIFIAPEGFALSSSISLGIGLSVTAIVLCFFLLREKRLEK